MILISQYIVGIYFKFEILVCVFGLFGLNEPDKRSLTLVNEVLSEKKKELSSMRMNYHT